MSSIGLRTKITLALLLLALVPLAVATTLLSRMNLSWLERSTKEYSLAVAGEARVVVQGLAESARAELSAAGLALAQEGVSINDRLRVARAHLLSARYVRSVVLYDREGRLIDAIRDESAEPGLPPAEALDARVLEQARKQGIATLPVQAAPSGARYLPMLTVLHQGAGDAVYAYLWTALPLAKLVDAMGALSEQRFGRKDGPVYLFEQGWSVIAHGDPARVGSSLTGRGFEADLGDGKGLISSGSAYSRDYLVDGEALLGEIVPIPELGWGILVEQPQEQAYSAVRTTWLTGVGVGVVFLVLALVVGLLMGRQLTSPILDVARAAGRVASGELDTRVAVRTRDEVGAMAEAFNLMLEGLQEREFIRETFGRYVTEEVAAKMLADPKSLQLGGEAKVVTILMSDLRGFTSLSERLGPQALVALLNRYFSRMTEVVMRFDGHISEFVGDGLVVFFGAPTAHADDPLRAMACAIAMQQELERFCADEGRPVEMGIGINTGEVIAGNIGSEKRMKYGVVGDAINVAARLESFTVGTQVMVSQASVDAAGGALELGELQEFSAKGKKEPLRCYLLQAVGAPYDLQMPEVAPDESERELQLQLQCFRIRGKQVDSEAVPGRTTHVASQSLRTETSFRPEPLSNLKLSATLPDGRKLEDLYAKVLSVEPSPSGDGFAAHMRLTSVPERERAILDELLGAGDE